MILPPGDIVNDLTGTAYEIEELVHKSVKDRVGWWLHHRADVAVLLRKAARINVDRWEAAYREGIQTGINREQSRAHQEQAARDGR